MPKKNFLQRILTASCLAAMAACSPSEPPKPDISAETAEVEVKVQKFKATPTKETREEVDRALAGLNAKIKELENRESQVSGAEKDRTAGKLSALRTQVQPLHGRGRRHKGASGRRGCFGKSGRGC